MESLEQRTMLAADLGIDLSTVDTGTVSAVEESVLYAEDFNDGVADSFNVQTGVWDASSGVYAATPVGGADAVSTVSVDGLVDNWEFSASINMDPGGGGLLSNAFLIFDYHSPTDFKFAGAYAGSDQWLIGHRTSGGWVTDTFVGGVIDPAVNYQLTAAVTADGHVTLSVDGVDRVTYQFTDSLTDGVIGVGTRNASSRFDNFTVQTTMAPPEPVPTMLPVSENFNDGLADNFQVVQGSGSVSGDAYHLTTSVGVDAISTLLVDGDLPPALQLQATINMDPAGGGLLSNGFIIFDYVSPTNFKFAGAYAGSDQWLIGHRDGGGWNTDAVVGGTIDPLTNYQLNVLIEADGTVTLSANGVEQVSYKFSESLTDGAVGLATREASTRFDDFSATEYAPAPPPSADLPYQENFEDGVADFFEVKSGTWTVAGGRYAVSPSVAGEGVSLLQVAALPDELEVAATMNMDPADAGFFSNSFLVFDYHGATDFKFAGAYAGADQWVIGHYSLSSGWITDAYVDSVIDDLVDYDLQLVISSSGLATLSVGGVEQVSYQFAESLTDGDVGLGTRNAISSFDEVYVGAPRGSQDPPSDPPVWENAVDTLLARLDRQLPSSRPFDQPPFGLQRAIDVLSSRPDKAGPQELTAFGQKKEKLHDSVFAQLDNLGVLLSKGHGGGK